MRRRAPSVLLAHDLHDAYQITGPTFGAQGELQDEVPPYEPGDELPEGGVGEGVRATGDRHARGELRVAKRRQGAGHPRHDVGEGYGGSGVLGRRLPGQDEEAGADDHPDAEYGEI